MRQFHIRLDAPEAALLVALAEKAKCSCSAVVRRAVLLLQVAEQAADRMATQEGERR